MGKLHCFEETGEDRQAEHQEPWWHRDAAEVWYGNNRVDVPILRRLPDAEAEEMRKAKEEVERLRAENAAQRRELDAAMRVFDRIVSHEIKAMDAAELRAGRPADADRAEVERIAEALLIHADGVDDGPHAFLVADCFITERNRRRAESVEA